ncbi:MAG: exo-alpha-sialidase, partial [Opitutaceae bacterium]
MPPGEQPKGLSYYERPDGVTVALWKDNMAALSPDGGKTWTPIGRHPFPESSAKIWGQRTGDGRYALVYDHSATERNRFPLVVVTSDDGHDFDHLLAIHGEVPPLRYQGMHKPAGPQYVRGITPGNGNPPGDHMWVTYSMNKEDIWVTRVRVPVIGEVGEAVREDFESAETGADLALWNLYIPQ